MKKFSMILAAAGCMAVAAPVMVTPASAYVVRKTVIVKRPVVRACRTVKTVSTFHGVRRVTTRRVCG